MTDKTNEPEMDNNAVGVETEQEVDAGLSEAFLSGLLNGSPDNPKPDTAQGVGEMLRHTVSMVEDRCRSTVSVIGNDEDEVLMLLKPDGGVSFAAADRLDDMAANPRFRRGTANMTSLDSFIDHINRFGDRDSAVFARDCRDNPGLLAVLDYHRADEDVVEEGDDGNVVVCRDIGEYRHGKHRVAFDFPVSDEWAAWTNKNGVQMSMTDFAHFLEDNVLDVAEMGDDIPESAERFVEMCGGKKNIADWSMLTALAKSLSVFESATVTEVTDLHGGAVNLTIAEGHDTEVAGVKATVPTMFFIAIPIFRDGSYYRLPIRLRYRKTRGGVVFWFEMWREDRAFMDAVKDSVGKVGTDTLAQTFYGTPEA